MIPILRGNGRGRRRIDELLFAVPTHAGLVHTPVPALVLYLDIGPSDTLYKRSSRPLDARGGVRSRCVDIVNFTFFLL